MNPRVSLAFALLLAACRTAGVESSAPETTVRAVNPAHADAPTAATQASGGAVGVDPGNAGRGTPLSPRPGHQLAAFAAGCFWGVEDAFRRVPGVTATAVGYAGGHTADPTYAEVCEHGTGHAETLLVEFDPARVSYARLVDVFFRIHDPTTPNRQGPDVGDQYRSGIFTFSPEQDAAARSAIAAAGPKLHRPIVTEVARMGAFYKAEAYHQQYAERTGTHGCPIRDPFIDAP